MKYQADTTMTPALDTIVMRAGWKTVIPGIGKPDLVIPVPLYRRRLQERGLNQSYYIARALFDEKIIDTSILQRNRATSPQTGLTGAERRRNLSGAFMVEEQHLLEDKVICVVDDVFTTGTTVMECCHALKKGGATEIYVVTLARVMLDG